MIKCSFYRIIFSLTLATLSVVLVACGTDDNVTASDDTSEASNNAVNGEQLNDEYVVGFQQR